MSRSYLEEAFDRMIDVYHLPQPVREHRFYSWRFDFAWPTLRVAVEIDGGTYGGPKMNYHLTGKRYQQDCIKSNQAQIEGWIILRADREMIHDVKFMHVLNKALLLRVKCCKQTGNRHFGRYQGS